ncbi:MAG TPA: N-acetylmuramic acid 6-phosphate etherase [Terriglobales bacterium]|nr:N-acetylmuramic acid 6-phosphate etherase [Stellaceae bacterium]HZT72949.1 N-acetylmuramic acid 6-phosphate etherase [Terriglobales bacterium]
MESSDASGAPLASAGEAVKPDDAAAVSEKRKRGRPRKPRPPAELDALITEQTNPASEDLDLLRTREILQLINREDAKVARAVRKAIPQIAKAVEFAVDSLSRGGRLIYIGAGTSGRLGVLDAVECTPTFNIAPGTIVGLLAGGYRALSSASEVSEDNPRHGARDLHEARLDLRDTVIGIAASGRTPYTLGALKFARTTGAHTVALTCVPQSPMAEAAEVAIAAVVGAEIVSGSTRMKAGTAQKMILNMISTTTMVRLGYVYSNLMVNVRANNEKLRARAERILRQATGVTAADARRLLGQAREDVRVAIIMAMKKVSARAAREALARHGYSLRGTLADVFSRA